MAQRSLCHFDPFRGLWPVEKVYWPRANPSSRLFHSKGEGPALGIVASLEEFAHAHVRVSNCSKLFQIVPIFQILGEVRARLSAIGCLSVCLYTI